jgi:stearoyl-CoA desaturase (delta-9 desaturase)
MESLKQDRANGLAGGAFESRGTTAVESPKGEGVAGFWDDSAALEAVGSKQVEAAPLQISWGPAAWLVALHLGALAAPWTFSWSGLAIAVGFHWLCGSLGICLGYHRLLTHLGMETPTWVRQTLAFLGVLSGEGGPISWCANHRRHHAYSDQEGDPHSPKDGPWWAHMFWLAFTTDGGDFHAYTKKWVPDLVKDRGLMWLERFFLPIHLVFGALLTGLGYAIGGKELAVSWLVWGVCVRLVLILHTTWFVNSASHIWGYRNYETRDESRNLWWVGLLAYGEGWHNNHHAMPRLAQHGHKWWEIDMTYWFILGLKRLGLARNVIDLKSVQEKRAKGKKVA